MSTIAVVVGAVLLYLALRRPSSDGGRQGSASDAQDVGFDAPDTGGARPDSGYATAPPSTYEERRIASAEGRGAPRRAGVRRTSTQITPGGAATAPAPQVGTQAKAGTQFKAGTATAPAPRFSEG